MDIECKVVKRNGNREVFDQCKLELAIESAFDSNSDEDIEVVVDSVITDILEVGNTAISTESINDFVEKSLMRLGFFVEARNFILYREEIKNIKTMSVDNDTMSEYIFVNRYSRYIPRKKRRENWNEAVDRVRDMHLRKYPEASDELFWAFEQVRQKKVLPSMRSLQFGGEPIEKTNARIYNCSYAVVDRVDFFSETAYLLLSGCGVGFSVEFENVKKLPKIVKPSNTDIRHITIDDTIEGWADAVKELIVSYTEGYVVEFIYKKIRKEGSKIRSGGKAPGHVPLRKALEKVRGILDGAVGRGLKPIEAYDITMHIADCVISGGVRRSACICLFSPDDSEMMSAKTGTWFEDNPQRARSNNSVKMHRDTTTREQFMRLFEAQKEFGEPGFLFVSNMDMGVNPCYHKDTRIATADGWERIEDMYRHERNNSVLTDNRIGKIGVPTKELGVTLKNASPVALTQRNAKLYKVTTDHGNEVITTANHKFITTNGRVELKDISIGENILLMSGKGAFGSLGTYEEGLLLGMIAGDGCISRKDSVGVAFADVWYKGDAYDPQFMDAIECTVNKVIEDYTDDRWVDRDSVRWFRQSANNGYSKFRIGGVRLCKWLKDIGIENKRDVPEMIWSGSEETIRGYINGLFYSDGSVQMYGASDNRTNATLSVRLTQNDKEYLKSIQILLNGFGVVSKIYSRRSEGYYSLPDGNGGLADYKCKEVFELIINRPNAVLMEDNKLLMLDKAILLSEHLDVRGRTCSKGERYIATIIDIEYVGMDDVYCLTEPDTNTVISNGIVNGQCAEISLNPYLEKGFVMQDGTILEEKTSGFAFCNLTTINGAVLHSREDFKSCVKAATIIGTCQAGYTDFDYLSIVSEEICKREALLGVSITGIMDSPDIALNPDIQREMAGYAIEVNQEISKLININTSARVTCVKPEGCFSPDTKIRTTNGTKSFMEIFEDNGYSINDIKAMEKVFLPMTTDISIYNEKNEEELLTKLFVNGINELVEVALEDGSTIRCTPWHKFKLTNGVWKRADELDINDDILNY